MPKHAVVTGVDWTPEIVRGIEGLLAVNYIYQSERWTSASNVVELPSYSIWDFRFGFQSERWSVIGYVDNAFEDTKVKSTFANTYNQGISVAAPPFTFILPLNQTPILPPERSYGVRMGYRFGNAR